MIHCSIEISSEIFNKIKDMSKINNISLNKKLTDTLVNGLIYVYKKEKNFSIFKHHLTTEGENND